MFNLTIPGLESIDAAARKLLESFPERRVFAFRGEMGVGKTTFIKALCRALDVRDITSSPSFGLIHEYMTEGGSSVYHFDLYRIESVEEVFDIGYEEYVYSGQYCFLEWPELVEPILPDDTLHLLIRTIEGGARELIEIGKGPS